MKAQKHFRSCCDCLKHFLVPYFQEAAGNLGFASLAHILGGLIFGHQGTVFLPRGPPLRNLSLKQPRSLRKSSAGHVPTAHYSSQAGFLLSLQTGCKTAKPECERPWVALRVACHWTQGPLSIRGNKTADGIIFACPLQNK